MRVTTPAREVAQEAELAAGSAGQAAADWAMPEQTVEVTAGRTAEGSMLGLPFR